MKRRLIIHKYILTGGDYFYFCNRAVRANWLKTDISNRKVNCKNCLKQKKNWVMSK